MTETRMSACKFCGQTAMVEAETEAEALHLATMNCRCQEACAYQEAYWKAEEAITEMREMYGTEKVQERLVDSMEDNIRMMALGIIAKVQYDLPNGKKLKVTKKGSSFSIECSRADKKKVDV